MMRSLAVPCWLKFHAGLGMRTHIQIARAVKAAIRHRRCRPRYFPLDWVRCASMQTTASVTTQRS